MTDKYESTKLRHNWQREEIVSLLDIPLMELLHRAATVHRQHFDPNQVQVSTLLSIKTGGCAEDCAYCPQSARYNTEVEADKLMQPQAILKEAKKAKAAGASRFCMGAAWRELKDRDVPKIEETIRLVKAEGLETCMTLGMLKDEQAETLKEAGLDYYNHNLDTAPELYGDIITTRTYDDRKETLARVRDVGMKTCSGGIVGMGESRDGRAGLLQELANLPEHPESVPINMLVQVEGTPMANLDPLDPLEFVRSIAVARIIMPKSFVRLSAGREKMSDEMQAMCFYAGANSIFYGEKLLTTPNPIENDDMALFKRLGISPLQLETAVDDDWDEDEDTTSPVGGCHHTGACSHG